MLENPETIADDCVRMAENLGKMFGNTHTISENKTESKGKRRKKENTE